MSLPILFYSWNTSENHSLWQKNVFSKCDKGKWEEDGVHYPVYSSVLDHNEVFHENEFISLELSTLTTSMDVTFST